MTCEDCVHNKSCIESSREYPCKDFGEKPDYVKIRADLLKIMALFNKQKFAKEIEREMAQYHKNLQYHEDTVKKRSLNAEDVQFLLELQKEMNTQDTFAQAEPRFWVIKGMVKEGGIESGYEDGIELIDNYGDAVATDLKSAVEYIREYLIDEIPFYIKWEDNAALASAVENGEVFSRFLYNMEELVEWMYDFGYEWYVKKYKLKEYIYPDTMFLTQKEAEKHLRENRHHYSENAYTYAMTAWRSPQVERLWKILEEVNWEDINFCTEKENNQKG